jgi:hypothetical protein
MVGAQQVGETMQGYQGQAMVHNGKHFISWSSFISKHLITWCKRIPTHLSLKETSNQTHKPTIYIYLQVY